MSRCRGGLFAHTHTHTHTLGLCTLTYWQEACTVSFEPPFTTQAHATCLDNRPCWDASRYLTEGVVFAYGELMGLHHIRFWCFKWQVSSQHVVLCHVSVPLHIKSPFELTFITDIAQHRGDATKESCFQRVVKWKLNRKHRMTVDHIITKDWQNWVNRV